MQTEEHSYKEGDWTMITVDCLASILGKQELEKLVLKQNVLII